MTLVVLVPVLGRPQRVRPTLDGFAPHRVLFIADPHDVDEQRAIREADGELLIFSGNYAEKINRGAGVTDEPLLFLGADDLRPLNGWLERAMARLDPAQVVGINDLISRPNRPTHATHFLMTRDYAEQPCADGSRGPLYEEYDHSCIDDELIATATHRGVYDYAEDAYVEHLHPDNGKGDWDPTYEKGRVQIRRDLRCFRSRTPLWT